MARVDIQWRQERDVRQKTEIGLVIGYEASGTFLISLTGKSLVSYRNVDGAVDVAWS